MAPEDPLQPSPRDRPPPSATLTERQVGAIGALVVVLSVGALWIGSRPSSPESRCPPDHPEELARGRRIERLLASTARGRRLLESRRDRIPICFGEGAESALVEGGAAVLGRGAGDGENAARLGHLLLHASEGPLLSAPTDRRPCALLVEETIAAEARAHALELELRRELGVTRPGRAYAFESSYWAAAPDRRLALIRDHLRVEPDGLARAYATRCASLRAAPSR